MKMQETQSELSDNELRLFNALLDMTKDGGGCTYTVADIYKKIEKDDDINPRALQTWIGNTIKQFSLFDQKLGRVKNQRSYLFSHERIKNIFERYQTGGRGGKVAEALKIKGYESATSKIPGGIMPPVGGSDELSPLPPLPPKTAEKQNNICEVSTTLNKTDIVDLTNISDSEILGIQ